MFSLSKPVARLVFAAVTVSMTPVGFVRASAPAMLSAWDQGALDRARSGAGERLQKPECLGLLHEFSDADGQPLQRNLEPFGLDAADYLEALAFKDGSAIGDCRRGSVYLATSVGLPSVFVCPAGGATPGSRFAQVQARNPALAEFMVIHEMLHTLGLGENPPTSLEITERVMERCQ